MAPFKGGVQSINFRFLPPTTWR